MELVKIPRAPLCFGRLIDSSEVLVIIFYKSYFFGIDKRTYILSNELIIFVILFNSYGEGNKHRPENNETFILHVHCTISRCISNKQRPRFTFLV